MFNDEAAEISKKVFQGWKFNDKFSSKIILQ
jgi:hypothetical protein